MSACHNRLVRRRWLASAWGLIVITRELVEDMILIIQPDNPALAAKLQSLLDARYGGER